MYEVKYKKGLYTEIPDNKVVSVRRYKHKYSASILDKNTLKIYRSGDYAKLENVNNFLEKYGIRLIF